MTKRKKWPHGAEDARLEAIAKFTAIHDDIRNAQDLMGGGNTFAAVILLGKAADKATAGKTTLQRAKDAPEALP